jgi:putative hydrolase of the HAD superfamily
VSGINQLELVLFDLDGTLIDRSASLQVFSQECAVAFEQSFNFTVKNTDLYAIFMLQDKNSYRSRPDFAAAVTAHPLLASSGISAAWFLDYWWRVFPGCTRLMPDCLAALTAIGQMGSHGLRLGIVSNGRTVIQHAKIQQAGIANHFEHVVISEAIGIKKPAREIFDHALGLFGLAANQALFVGDHWENDIVGAQNVGMLAIWLSPEQASTPACTLIANDLLEVATIIEQKRHSSRLELPQ